MSTRAPELALTADYNRVFPLDEGFNSRGSDCAALYHLLQEFTMNPWGIQTLDGYLDARGLMDGATSHTHIYAQYATQLESGRSVLRRIFPTIDLFGL